MDFDPDAYLAQKAPPLENGGFDPDAYLASKAPAAGASKEAAPRPSARRLNAQPAGKHREGQVSTEDFVRHSAAGANEGIEGFLDVADRASPVPTMGFRPARRLFNAIWNPREDVPESDNPILKTARAGGKFTTENLPVTAGVTGLALRAENVVGRTALENSVRPGATSAAAAERVAPVYDVNSPLVSGAKVAADKLASPVRAVGDAFRSLSPSQIGATAKGVVEPFGWNNQKLAANSVLDWTAKHPGKAVAGDMSSNFQAGAGEQIGRQYAADEGGDEAAQNKAGQVGQFGPQTVLGLWRSFAPSVLFGRGAKKVYNSALGNVSNDAEGAAAREADRLAYSNREGKYADPNVPAPQVSQRQTLLDEGASKRARNTTNMVAKDLGRTLAIPENAANLAETERLRAEIPGFNPGVAAAADDASLKLLHNRFGSEASGERLRELQGRHDATTQSLRDKFEELVPQKPWGIVPPQDVVHGVEARRVQAAEAARDADVAALEKKIRAAENRSRKRTQALPGADNYDTGERFRTAHELAERAADREQTRLRNNIVGLHEPIQVGDKTMTLNEAIDARTGALQKQRLYGAARGTIEGADRLEELGAQIKELNRAINAVDKPGMDAFRAHWRDHYILRYGQGAGEAVLSYREKGYDHNRIPNEKVLEQFGGPNNISAAKQFTLTHGDNPDMIQMMVEHQLGRYKDTMIKPETGLPRKQALAKFLAQNERLFNALPPEVWQGVVKALPQTGPKNLEKLAGAVKQTAKRDIESNLGAIPEDTVTAAMTDWQRMRALRQAVGPDSAALPAAVMKHAPDLSDGKAFREWMEHPSRERALREALSPQHYQDIQKLARAAEIHGRVARPTGKVEEPSTAFDAVKNATGTSVPTGLTTITTLARGRSSPLYEISRLAGNAMNSFSKAQAEKVWQAALFDPSIARTINEVLATKKVSEAQYSKMYAYLGTVAAHDANEDVKLKTGR